MNNHLVVGTYCIHGFVPQSSSYLIFAPGNPSIRLKHSAPGLAAERWPSWPSIQSTRALWVDLGHQKKKETKKTLST